MGVIKIKMDFYYGEMDMFNSIFKFQEGERRVLTEGSFVSFYSTHNNQFNPNGDQGFVEEIQHENEEVNIRTLDGKIIKGISIHRVFL